MSAVATVSLVAWSYEPGTSGAVMFDRGERDTSSLWGSSDRSNALQLLRDRHADSIDHLSGVLLDHLERTERLLLAWGSTDALATAGLCHAVYGTDGFAPVLLGLDERAALTAAVGPDVEGVVYFYASCDRDYLYPQIGAGKPTTFRDRFTGEVFPPSKEQLTAFADLTLANETDVATCGDARRTVPEWFISLTRTFAPLATREVADACEVLIATAGEPAP